MPSALASPGVRLLDALLDVARQTQCLLTALNQTTGTIPANIITGGVIVDCISSNAAPGTQTTRTAAQMYADDPCAYPGDQYQLRIANSGAGTLTLAGGAGVTTSGTMTVAVATVRTFNVTYSGTAQVPLVTITNVQGPANFT